MADEPMKEMPKTDSKHTEEDGSGLSLLDALRILTGLLALNFLLSYFITGNSLFWGYRAWWTRPESFAAKLRSPIVLTDDQLLAYAGQNESLPIYLALNGTIFDVTAGRRIYGPGGPYNHFAGRDAARAYVTGCFKDDSVADMRGVEWTFIPQDVPHFLEKSDQELSEKERGYRYEMVDKAIGEVEGTIKHWAKVFRGETGKEYFEVGYVDRDWKIIDRLPLRTLCEAAEKKRPKKTQFDEEKEYKRPLRAVQSKRKYERWAQQKDRTGRKTAKDEL